MTTEKKSTPATAKKRHSGVPRCSRGGNEAPHDAKWVTTSKAVSEIAYCERHKPANHQDEGLKLIHVSGEEADA